MEKNYTEEVLLSIPSAIESLENILAWFKCSPLNFSRIIFEVEAKLTEFRGFKALAKGEPENLKLQQSKMVAGKERKPKEKQVEPMDCKVGNFLFLGKTNPSRTNPWLLNQRDKAYAKPTWSKARGPFDDLTAKRRDISVGGKMPEDTTAGADRDSQNFVLSSATVNVVEARSGSKRKPPEGAPGSLVTSSINNLACVGGYSLKSQVGTLKAKVSIATADMPEDYNGNPMICLEDWFLHRKCQLLKRMLPPTPAQEVADIVMHLKGLARIFYDKLDPAIQGDPEALKAALLAQFSNKERVFAAEWELHEAQQGPHEPVHEFSNRIAELVRACTKGLPEAEVDRCLRWHILYCLRPELKEFVVEHAPENYDEVLKLARRKETQLLRSQVSAKPVGEVNAVGVTAKVTKSCFACKRPGHLVKNCPNRTNGRHQFQVKNNPKANGRSMAKGGSNGAVGQVNGPKKPSHCVAGRPTSAAALDEQPAGRNHPQKPGVDPSVGGNELDQGRYVAEAVHVHGCVDENSAAHGKDCGKDPAFAAQRSGENEHVGEQGTVVATPKFQIKFAGSKDKPTPRATASIFMVEFDSDIGEMDATPFVEVRRRRKRTRKPNAEHGQETDVGQKVGCLLKLKSQTSEEVKKIEVIKNGGQGKAQKAAPRVSSKDTGRAKKPRYPTSKPPPPAPLIADFVNWMNRNPKYRLGIAQERPSTSSSKKDSPLLQAARPAEVAILVRSAEMGEGQVDHFVSDPTLAAMDVTGKVFEAETEKAQKAPGGSNEAVIEDDPQVEQGALAVTASSEIESFDERLVRSPNSMEFDADPQATVEGVIEDVSSTVQGSTLASSFPAFEVLGEQMVAPQGQMEADLALQAADRTSEGDHKRESDPSSWIPFVSWRPAGYTVPTQPVRGQIRTTNPQVAGPSQAPPIFGNPRNLREELREAEMRLLQLRQAEALQIQWQEDAIIRGVLEDRNRAAREAQRLANPGPSAPRQGPPERTWPAPYDVMASSNLGFAARPPGPVPQQHHGDAQPGSSRRQRHNKRRSKAYKARKRYREAQQAQQGPPQQHLQQAAPHPPPVPLFPAFGQAAQSVLQAAHQQAQPRARPTLPTIRSVTGGLASWTLQVSMILTLLVCFASGDNRVSGSRSSDLHQQPSTGLADEPTRFDEASSSLFQIMMSWVQTMVVENVGEIAWGFLQCWILLTFLHTTWQWFHRHWTELFGDPEVIQHGDTVEDSVPVRHHFLDDLRTPENFSEWVFD